MVTWYDIISSRWSSHFWVKLQVKLVDEMIQSVYLCVILHVKHKNSPFIAILTWFLILGKIQDGGQDGDNFGRRHRPPTAPPTTKCTYSCWEDQRLSTEGKSFRNAAKYQKLLGGVPSSTPATPPPPSTCMYRGGGFKLSVRPRVNLCKKWTRVFSGKQ